MKQMKLRGVLMGALFFPSVLLAAENSQNLVLDSIETLETTEVRTKKQVSTKESMQGQELFQKTGDNLANTLEKEKNFSKRSMGPAPARPVVRGLGGDHVSIAENGTSVVDLSGTSPDHAVGSSQGLVRRVEVVQGVDLLSHSLSLLGALIDLDRGLFMVDAEEDFNGRIQNSFSSYNQGWQSSLQLELPVTEWTLRLQGSGSLFQEASSPLGVLKNTDSKQGELAGGLQWDLENQRWGLDASIYSLEYGIPGGFVGSHLSGVRIAFDRTNGHVGQALRGAYGELITTLSWDQFSQVETEVAGPVGAEFGVEEWEVKSVWTQKEIAKKTDLEMGFSGGYEDRNYGGFVYTPMTQRMDASFWSIVRYSKEFTFSLGARLEWAKDELFGFYAKRQGEDLPEGLFWAHAFSVDIEKSWKEFYSRLGLFQTSRIPSVEELYSQGPHLAAYSYDRGNENLGVERGYGAKLEGGFQKEWALGAEIYGVYYTDFIHNRPLGKINWSTGLPEYQTTSAEAILWGAAFDLESPRRKGLAWKFLWDYNQGDDLKEGDPLPAISPMRVLNTVSFRLAAWTLQTRGETFFAQNRLAKFETRTPANTVFHLDLFWQKAHSWGLLRAQLSVENLLDQKYQNHLSRIKEILPEPGRNFIAKLQWGF